MDRAVLINIKNSSKNRFGHGLTGRTECYGPDDCYHVCVCVVCVCVHAWPVCVRVCACVCVMVMYICTSMHAHVCVYHCAIVAME